MVSASDGRRYAYGTYEPRPGSLGRQIWDIIETVRKRQAEPAMSPARSDVLDACEAEGLNLSSASTHLGLWRQFHGLADTRFDPLNPRPAKTRGRRRSKAMLYGLTK